jgi:hypothetical protein
MVPPISLMEMTFSMAALVHSSFRSGRRGAQASCAIAARTFFTSS